MTPLWPHSLAVCTAFSQPGSRKLRSEVFPARHTSVCELSQCFVKAPPHTLPHLHTSRRHSEASTKALAQFTQLFGDVGEAKPAEGKGKGGGKGSNKEEENVRGGRLVGMWMGEGKPTEGQGSGKEEGKVRVRRVAG